MNKTIVVNTISDSFQSGTYSYSRICFNEIIYFERGESFSEEVCESNIYYMFNYDGSDNGGYFSSDYRYEDEFSIDEITSIPQRKDYEFGGWYKEKECINKWDFETDKGTADAKTYLYAKWVE